MCHSRISVVRIFLLPAIPWPSEELRNAAALNKVIASNREVFIVVVF